MCIFIIPNYPCANVLLDAYSINLVDNNCRVKFYGNIYEGVLTTTYSQGDTKYENVTSKNSSAYPTRGEALEGTNYYWYIYKGVY